jgi:hypothetical protein
VPEAAARQNAGNVRFLFFILWYLSSAVLVGVQMGVRVLRTKNDPAKLETLPLRWNLNLLGLIALSLGLFGLYNSATADSGSRYIICVVIGFLGIADYRESLRFLKNPRPTPRAWWYKHMECMIGCGIGFHTAFLVFGFSRLVPAAALPGGWALLPWIAPTAIGVPLMLAWIRYYKRRFGELEYSPEPAIR